MESLSIEHQVGFRNLISLYIFNATSKLWFDGGLWLLYFQHKGITLFQVGILEAILHIVAVVSDLPIGIFADRFGWKLSLSIGSLMGVGYTLIALLGDNFWWFATAFACRGLQVTFTNGSDSAVAYESALWAGLREQYLRISGRLFAIGLVSLGLAEGLGGLMAHFSWSFIYEAFTLANVLSFVVVLTIREPRKYRVTNHAAQRLSIVTISREAFHFARLNPTFLGWISMSAVLSVSVASFGFYGQSLLIHSGWTLVGIGILTGVENGLGALASTLSDGLTRRYGQSAIITLANWAASIGLVLFAWLPGIMNALGYITASVSAYFIEPVIDQGLNRLVPSHQRATLLSANSTAFSLCMIIAFPLFGAFAQHIGLLPAARIVSLFAALLIIASSLVWCARVTREKGGQPINLESYSSLSEDNPK